MIRRDVRWRAIVMRVVSRSADFESAILASRPILADGDEFHLGRDDSLARVPELRDRDGRFRANWTTRRRRWWTSCRVLRLDQVEFVAVSAMCSMLLGKISIINRPNDSSLVFLHVAAFANPFGAQGRQALRDIAVKIGIAPRAAGVVNAHWFVHFDLAVHRFRRCERDFPEWDANIGMQFAGDVNLFGIETRSTPVSLAATGRGFTFYVARPARSVWQRAFPCFVNQSSLWAQS